MLCANGVNNRFFFLKAAFNRFLIAHFLKPNNNKTVCDAILMEFLMMLLMKQITFLNPY